MSTNIRVKRICEYCGNSFEARTTVTRYCSHLCNSRAYKDRIKNVKIDMSDQQTIEVIEKSITELKAKDFLSLAETCTILGISRMTLHRQIKGGKIKAKRMGKRVIISRKHLEEFFK